MNRNGNNHGLSVAEAVETDSHQSQGESAFYDPSNPVLAPAREIIQSKRKNWKRRLIGWSLVALLLVGGAFVLYSLLKIKHVDVKVLADNRREGLSAKPESAPSKTENGLSAEA